MEAYLRYRKQDAFDLLGIDTSCDFAVAHFTVNKDAIHYVANVPRPEDRQLFRIGLEGGEPEQLTERAGTHDLVISPDGRFAADMFSSDRMPPELFLVPIQARL